MTLAEANRIVASRDTVLKLEIKRNDKGFAPHAAVIRKQREAHVGRVPKDEELRFVEIPVSPDGLGFEIAGRSEKYEGPHRNGVFVSTLTPGGVAEKIRNLHVGDQIVEIAGSKPGEWISLRTASSEQVASLIRDAAQSQKAVSIVVAENADAFMFINDALEMHRTPRVVKLDRASGVGFGFGIVGPVKAEDLDLPTTRGIYIAEIQPGSVAETQGHLRIGERIINVNDHAVISALHPDVVRYIQESGDSVRLEVVKDLNAFHRAEHTPKGIKTHSFRRSERASSRRQKSQKKKALEFPPLPFHIRALFNQPSNVDGLLSFSIGDILLVKNVQHADFWVADNISTQASGKIPSRRKVEEDFKPAEGATKVRVN